MPSARNWSASISSPLERLSMLFAPVRTTLPEPKTSAAIFGSCIRRTTPGNRFLLYSASFSWEAREGRSRESVTFAEATIFSILRDSSGLRSFIFITYIKEYIKGLVVYSSRVEMSPGSIPSSCAFKTRLMILPLRVLGSDRTNSISEGMAMGPSVNRTW